MDRLINTWSQDEIKRFWDYESQFIENYFTYQIGAQLAEKFNEYIADKKVLDYGAGAGFFCEKLAVSRAKSFWALETSPESIKLLAEKFNEISNFGGAFSPCELIKQNEKFDTIFLFEVIEHLDDQEIKNVFEKIRQMLNNEGTLIITTPNDEVIEKSFVCCPHCGKVFHRWQHVRSWDIHTLSDFLENEGFQIVQLYTTDLGKEEKQDINLWEKVKRIISSMLGIRQETDSNIDPHLVAVVKMGEIAKCVAL